MGTYQSSCLSMDHGLLEKGQELLKEASSKGVVGVFYLEHGNLTMARECFEEARLKVDIDATFKLGTLHAAEANADSAHELWEEAHIKASVEATYNLGVLYIKQD